MFGYHSPVYERLGIIPGTIKQCVTLPSKTSLSILRFATFPLYLSSDLLCRLLEQNQVQFIQVL